MDILETLTYFAASYELRLVTALFLFSTKMKKRERFALRILIFIPLLFTNTVFHFFGISLVTVLSVGWFSFFFLVEFVIGMAMVAFCYEIDWKRLLYVGTGAFTFQADCYAFMAFFRFALSPPASDYYWLIGLAILVSFSAILYFAVFRRKNFVTSGRMDAQPFVYVAVGSTLFLLLYFSYLIFRHNTEPQIYFIMSLVASLMLVILLMLVGRNVRVSEKEILQRLLIEKEKEYRITQESIALINQKSHDLKKVLAYFENTAEGPMLEEVRSISESIQKFDSIVTTGNVTVDIILSEKKLYCVHHDIDFTCVVDGKLFNAMSEVDIYTFLSNAIDNAIEATSKIEQKENRHISLRVYRGGDMARILVKNTFAEAPIFVRGMPITSKSDKQYHGFGVQSMKTTIKKYGGYFDCYVSDEEFVLAATLPL